MVLLLVYSCPLPFLLWEVHLFKYEGYLHLSLTCCKLFCRFYILFLPIEMFIFRQANLPVLFYMLASIILSEICCDY